MSGRNVSKITVFLSLLFISFIGVFPQDHKETSLRIMFYNTENLFDTYDDTLKDDDEFLPGGLRRWTYTRYKRKVNSIFKVIMAAGEWSPPALVAFCEIENRKVLEDIIYGTYLSKFGYDIIHEESPDPRGIDVCLIYRKDQIGFIDYSYLVPSSFNEEDFASRSVLYAKCGIFTDTVHLFVNHWPSRRGGVLAGEEHRRIIAEMVRNKADSISDASEGGAKIMFIGDFNATPEDNVMKVLTESHDSGAVMINLSENAVSADGTYRYMGTWEMIDQVLVSDMVLKSGKGLTAGSGSIHIFRPDFLLRNDPKYPGVSPFSTYSGYRYLGGFSDHLPVLIDLIVK